MSICPKPPPPPLATSTVTAAVSQLPETAIEQCRVQGISSRASPVLHSRSLKFLHSFETCVLWYLFSILLSGGCSAIAACACRIANNLASPFDLQSGPFGGGFGCVPDVNCGGRSRTQESVSTSGTDLPAQPCWHDVALHR